MPYIKDLRSLGEIDQPLSPESGDALTDLTSVLHGSVFPKRHHLYCTVAESCRTRGVAMLCSVRCGIPPLVGFPRKQARSFAPANSASHHGASRPQRTTTWLESCISDSEDLSHLVDPRDSSRAWICSAYPQNRALSRLLRVSARGTAACRPCICSQLGALPSATAIQAGSFFVKWCSQFAISMSTKLLYLLPRWRARGDASCSLCRGRIHANAVSVQRQFSPV